jgi:hypothetical protein
MTEQKSKDEDKAWGVFVTMPDTKRGAWLTNSGSLTRKRVHVPLCYGEEGRAKCERVAADVQESNEGVKAEARILR